MNHYIIVRGAKEYDDVINHVTRIVGHGPRDKIGVHNPHDGTYLGFRGPRKLYHLKNFSYFRDTDFITNFTLVTNGTGDISDAVIKIKRELAGNRKRNRRGVNPL